MSDDGISVDDQTPQSPTGQCVYECNGSEWILISGNPPPGYYCLPSVGACSAGQVGARRFEPAVQDQASQ